jgi:HMG box factor
MLKDPAGGDMRARMNDTVFAVSFVVWDIWKFLHAPLGDTIKNSISRSIDSLFEQLNRLPAESGFGDVRVVLMLSIDPTFLPAFDATTGQKDMVSIVEQWNRELQEKAREWEGGSMYIFDTNEFLLDQIRGYQYYAAGMFDADGLWKQNPWDDVEHPCVESTGKWMAFLGNESKTCENPDKFLFW